MRKLTENIAPVRPVQRTGIVKVLLANFLQRLHCAIVRAFYEHWEDLNNECAPETQEDPGDPVKSKPEGNRFAVRGNTGPFLTFRELPAPRPLGQDSNAARSDTGREKRT